MGTLALFLAAAAAISGQVRNPPCTATCRTDIRVAISPDKAAAGQPGRYFIGVFPVHEGRPLLEAGGYYDGRDWIIGNQPVAFAAQPLKPVSARVTVRQGICARARAAGAQHPRYVVAAGYGIDTVAAANRAAGVADDGGLDEASRNRIAAVNMLQKGTYRIVGEVTCE